MWQCGEAGCLVVVPGVGVGVGDRVPVTRSSESRCHGRVLVAKILLAAREAVRLAARRGQRRPHRHQQPVTGRCCTAPPPARSPPVACCAAVRGGRGGSKGNSGRIASPVMASGGQWLSSCRDIRVQGILLKEIEHFRLRL